MLETKVAGIFVATSGRFQKIYSPGLIAEHDIIW